MATGGHVVYTPTLLKQLKGQILEEVYRFERLTPKKTFFIIVKGLVNIIVYLHLGEEGHEKGANPWLDTCPHFQISPL